MQLTDNFSFEEFVQTSHREYADENYRYGMQNKAAVQWLANQMQNLRDCLGSPIIITSGVRCAKLNAAVGGAKNSQHTKFEAADFIVPGMLIDYAFNLIQDYKHVKYDQLILEESKGSKWIHISFSHEKPRRQVLVYNAKKYIEVKND